MIDWHTFSKEEQNLILKTLSSQVSAARWGQMQAVVQERTDYITLVLEDIYEAHNAAAALRTCESLGVHDVHVIEKRNCLNLSKSTVSKGAYKWLNVNYYSYVQSKDPLTLCLRNLKLKGYKNVAMTLDKGAKSLDKVPLDQPLAIFIGTEKSGLSLEALNAADYFVHLPMRGFVESLNLSVCAALVLHTLTERLRCSSYPWAISETKKRQILFQWLKKCIKHWDKILPSCLKKT